MGLQGGSSYPSTFAVAFSYSLYCTNKAAESFGVSAAVAVTKLTGKQGFKIEGIGQSGGEKTGADFWALSGRSIHHVTMFFEGSCNPFRLKIE